MLKYTENMQKNMQKNMQNMQNKYVNYVKLRGAILYERECIENMQIYAMQNAICRFIAEYALPIS
jgi:hypothetical protein